MYKFEFSKKELNDITNEAMFSELQAKIVELKSKEYSNTQICQELSISQSKLSKEIIKIYNKVKKVINF